jgi:L-seryl-tRNA(Ser) seleniumtransferase
MAGRGDSAALRSLPSVDRVLRSAAVAPLLDAYAREPVLRLVRRILDESRAEIEAGTPAPDAEEVARKVAVRAETAWSPVGVPVINATGVILHTNLGRAPLSADARAAMAEAAGYWSVELSLASGERGSRTDIVEGLLVDLLDADAAHVAVNNASAVLLALAALARGREVLVSRGESVEIGGGFRVPVILRQSGARLVEVGTTNRTRLQDYAEAIGPRTAAILHVHSSNFRIVGFTEQPAIQGLADLARRYGILCIVDNGSGSLLDTSRFGLRHEPMPAEAIAAGADVVAFSGDKLLGGPQAGLLAGRRDAIRSIRAHPLARALRPDKVTLAALAATLRSYIRGDAESALPVWQMIGQTADQVRARATAWQDEAAERGIRVALADEESTVGGGSLPGDTLPTTAAVLPSAITAASLRRATPPVVGRAREGRVLLDLRTVMPDEERALLSAVSQASEAIGGPKKRVIDSAAK